MKTGFLKSLNLFVIILGLQFSSIICSAQDPHPDRGVYVDKFFKFYLGTSTVDPSNTILGNAAKETALLDYCKVNHITHLALYDVSTILSATSTGWKTPRVMKFIQIISNGRIHLLEVRMLLY